MSITVQAARRLRGAATRMSWYFWSCRVLCILSVIWFGPAAAHAQEQITGEAVPVYNDDLAVMESQEHRKDLPCEVDPVKPSLGFDLRFQSGYEVSVPLRELIGTGDRLSILMRVTPEPQSGVPAYFSQEFSVPTIEPGAKGEATLRGAFELGEGKYHVDWLMRDRAQHVCSSHWDSIAVFAHGEADSDLLIPPGAVWALDRMPFKEESPVGRDSGDGLLHVKLLLNFAPQEDQMATLRSDDTDAFLTLLRRIAREPRIGRISVVAFNLAERRVLYRHENSTQIDFPALGQALKSLQLGTINLKDLTDSNGSSEFLTRLLIDELGQPEKPDALIFAGPNAVPEGQISPESLKEVGPVAYPVFYVNYNLNPAAHPWTDLIGKAVSFFKGHEYTITNPHDLWRACREVMSQLLSVKVGHCPAASFSGV